MSRAPFDFTSHMHGLCEDIAAQVPDFHHVDMRRVVVSFSQTRRAHRHGLQAKLTPMRFEGGALTARRQGRDWTVQRLYHQGREMLYILTFYLPRFQNHAFEEKLATVFHELFHIAPAFNGDLRRFEGHFYVHSHSQKQYDRHVAKLAKEYLALGPPDEVIGFLRKTFGQLAKGHGGVVGLRVPIPKLIPLRSVSA